MTSSMATKMVLQKQEFEKKIKEETEELEENFSLANTSRYLNDSTESGGGMEELLLSEHTVEVPADIFTDETIFKDIFSLHTWHHCISDNIKQYLMTLLPNFPRDDPGEKLKCLEMLFGGDSLAFGNPLAKFRKDVVKGNFCPDRRRLHQYVRNAKSRDARLEMEEYHFRLMHDVLKSRKQLLEETSGTPVSVPIAVQKLEVQSIQLGGRMRAEIKKRYLEELRRIKAEVGEEQLSSDDEEMVKECQAQDTALSLIPEFNTSVGDPRLLSSRTKEDPVLPPVGSSRSQEEERTGGSSLLTQESQPSYFHLLSDLFHLVANLRLTVPQIDQGMAVWQESPIAALNSWYSLCTDPRGWRSCIPSAVAFLCGSFPDQCPPNFQPFITVDEAQGSYQWIGEGREGSLSMLFDWWWERQDSCKAGIFTPNSKGDSSIPGEDTGSAGKSSSWRVRPSTIQERLEYQRQEAKRYANPTKAFRWVMQDYSVCVGPVKGALAVKGKNHVMLRPNRPPYVTILTLVRDAVSRLPNGEGSRTDIMELLLDSQYLTPNIDPTSLNTTVSGALDRLQNEVDACLKYDNNRKIWIYLHREKTMEELESMQVNSKPKPRSKKKLKLDGSGDSGGAGSELQQRSFLSSAILRTPGSSPQRFATSTPVRSSSQESRGSSSMDVQRIIVRGADGQILPLSPGTLQQLIDSGAIRGATL